MDCVERVTATVRRCEVGMRACWGEEVGGCVVVEMSRWWLVTDVDSRRESRGAVSESLILADQYELHAK
jgi:hypothetical protein